MEARGVERRLPAERSVAPSGVGVALLLSLMAAGCGQAVERADPGAHVVAGDGTAGFTDGSVARFNKPIRLAGLPDGSVAVADIYNHAIRRVEVSGAVTTLAGAPDRKGHEDGPGARARLAAPHGVAVRDDGVIAVAEAEGQVIRLLRPVDPAAAPAARRYVVETLAGRAGEGGMADGPANEARFQSPHAVLWLAGGGLLVADIGNARLRLVKDGRVTTAAGSGESGRADGPPATCSFTYPMDLALAPDGAVLIADAGSHLIRRWVPGGAVTTLALDRRLDTPHGIAAAPDGTIYVAEMGAHRICAIDPGGHVRNVFGTGEAGPGPDQLRKPAAVLVHAGRLWIADLDNHRILTLPID